MIGAYGRGRWLSGASGILWFLCILPALLFGQEAANPEPGTLDPEPALMSSEPAPPEDGSGGEGLDGAALIFYIRNIDFQVSGTSLTGLSRPFALMYHGEFKEGEELQGEDKLEIYVHEKTQLLLNQRVLESANIQYTLGEQEGDGRIPVDLLVTVVDSWNAIAIPYPKFDSNTGFELVIKARDYNFLGTMSPLRVDLGFERRDNDREPIKNILTLGVDSDIPFQLWGLRWIINFDNVGSLTLSGGDKTISFKNTTGLAMELPLQRTTLTVGVEENAVYHEENPLQYREKYGEFAGFYVSGELYASWKIPMGIMIYDLGELTYTPKVSGKMNLRFGGELEPWRKGPSATFSHTLGFGRIDWLGNYRRGLEASGQFAYTYNLYRKGWDNNYSFSVIWHRPFTSFFGLSSRFQFKQWFFDRYAEDPSFSYAELGEVMRGILNSSLIARNFDFMFSINLDFPFHVLRFVPSQWFQTKNLKFFDFDLHVSPFIDIGMLQGWSKVSWENGQVESKKSLLFIPQDMLFTAGIEIIAFPAFMRSLYVRASIGYNLNKLVETGHLPKWDELFVGIGHHY